MTRPQTRIYWRERGGARRAYGDFRSLGGGREPLVAPGEKLATTDPQTAQVLLARRISELDAVRRGRVLHGVAGQATLADFARTHLVAKAKADAVTDRWLEATERQLKRAVEHFGATRDLASLTVAEVRTWIEKLAESGISGGTARHHLNALSNLYRRAQAEGFVTPGFNPPAGLMEKPKARREEARWLEAHEAALLVESARTYVPKREDLAVPFAHAMIAAFMLTGARRSELLGIEVGDVSFDRKTVTFRPNAWRRLKTAGAHRVVPLWPQLEEILRPYVFGSSAPPGRLLFPSFKTGREAMFVGDRKLLDAVAVRAGWKAGEVRCKAFRHTYTAARLQTLDCGAPVSPFTVSRELGHGSLAMVQRVYGHLGQVRHRAEAVEYRVEQHSEALRERLAGLAQVAKALP